jgi:hypothetical protein
MQMNRKLANTGGNIKEESVGETRRFTVDSVVGDSLRILVAKLARPVETRDLSALAPFNIWEKEEEIVAKRNEAAAMIGVEPALLLEGRVFLRKQKQTSEITELVRKESKKAYAPLLSREFHRRGSVNW